MSPLDILLIMLGLFIVALCLYARFVRALFLLVGAYTATLMGLFFYQLAAFRLQAIGKGAIWFEGTMFLLIFFVILLAFFLISRAAYPDTTLPKLGSLDYLLGAPVGILVAGIVITMIYQSLGVMVSEYWEPYDTFASMSALHGGLHLAPFLRTFRSLYGYLFYPFFFNIGFPPVLTVG
ncbi:MAG: CvpA family protein [Chloroflexota bacterium]|nr:CvpA family protein [Chloroflexota bacterium]